MLDFRESWARAWSGIGAVSNGADTCTALLARYSETHRQYHTLAHLRECLALFESVRGLALNAAEVEIALWFHDAIYEIRRSDNEERSAEWARSAIEAGGAAAPVAQRVHALVMVTKHTGVPAGADEQLLVDIDLGILGAAKERFAEYERQIRAEYADVPTWLFKRKRREILSSFLDRPRIYGTAHFHDALEPTARENLRFAIGKGAP